LFSQNKFSYKTVKPVSNIDAFEHTPQLIAVFVQNKWWP